MTRKKVFVGIDMGATHIRICVMNDDLNVLTTEKRKTHDVIDQGLVTGLIGLCNEFIKDRQILHIVIGLPAAISFNRSKVLSVPNLNLQQEVLDSLVPNLSSYYQCTVHLERDVNLQMIHDVHHYHLANQLVLGAYLGTGIGFSIWYNNGLFIGANGVAGELGHIPYGDFRFKCGCGNYGCLETSCSGIVLTHWYESQQFDFPMEELFIKMESHPFLQDYLQQIAKAISTTVNLFDPNALILGGGVMDMPAFPIEKLKTLIAQYIRKPLPYEKLAVFKAESSSFSGAMGAAIYAKQLH